MSITHRMRCVSFASIAALSMSIGVARADSPVTAASVIDLSRFNDWTGLVAAYDARGDTRQHLLIEAKLRAARLDEAGVEETASHLLAAEMLTAEEQAFVHALVADVRFAEGHYAAAAESAQTWRTLLDATGTADDKVGADQFLAVARLLAAAPAQALLPSEPQIAVTRRDKVGLVRSDVAVNTGTVNAVLDTGANLSVVSRSTAERLGLTLLAGEAAVGSATMKSVAIQMAVADKLTIAGAEFRNVAFLVMDDAALTFPVPGGYKIDAIIGFPVFKALGRISFSKQGSMTWQKGAGGKPVQNMFIGGNDLYLAAEVAGMPASLHLDTGATGSELGSIIADRNPALVQAGKAQMRQQASAGGAVSDSVLTLSGVDMRLAGVPLCITNIDLALPAKGAEAPTSMGTIGQDLLTRFNQYSIDFTTMRFDMVPDTAEAGECHEKAAASPE